MMSKLYTDFLKISIQAIVNHYIHHMNDILHQYENLDVLCRYSKIAPLLSKLLT